MTKIDKGHLEVVCQSIGAARCDFQGVYYKADASHGAYILCTF